MEKSEKELPELCVGNPYIIEEAIKDQDASRGEIEDSEKVQLLYQSPRLFRKSIIHKTLKLFGTKDHEEPKLNRTFKEK